MCPEASDTYLNVGDTEYRDCLNLILARSGWLQLIQGCKEAVKIIHSGHRHRHDARPTLRSPPNDSMLDVATLYSSLTHFTGY